MSLSASAPWLKYYGEVPHHLTYPQKTIYQMVRYAARGRGGWLPLQAPRL